MRVLIVNSMFANRLYRRAADELGQLPDIELTMLTVDRWVMNDRPMLFDELQTGSPYATIVGKAGWRGKENRGFYRTGVVRALRLSKPDVIFLMEEPFSIFALQVLAAKSAFAPKARIVFFTWNNLSLEKFDYRPGIFYRAVSRWALPRMQSALTANNDGHKVLRDAGFEGPITTVGYGVDSETYASVRQERAQEIREQLGIQPNDIVIGYVGRLIEKKGIDLLIDAFAEVKSANSRHLKLLLVGGGEEEEALIHRAKQRRIFDALRHVPTVTHGEVPDYMHALDIFVLPSRRRAMWAEQFGRVLVEAMAARKIVIGSSSGAIPEVIADAGLVFEENNVASLVQTLNRALQMTEYEKEQLTAIAYNRATEHYSWKRFAMDARDAIVAAYKGATT